VAYVSYMVNFAQFFYRGMKARNQRLAEASQSQTA
jgi:hypothetical protein